MFFPETEICVRGTSLHFTKHVLLSQSLDNPANRLHHSKFTRNLQKKDLCSHMIRFQISMGKIGTAMLYRYVPYSVLGGLTFRSCSRRYQLLEGGANLIF